MLVPHSPGFRRLWMFPRNIRRISPWKVGQVLSLFDRHVRQSQWAGNQELQNNFRNALEDAGLVRQGAPYHPQSGGPRTFESQLKALGLIFARPDGSIWLTRAGDDIKRAEAPLQVIQSQILRFQFPSFYSGMRQVAINPKLRVKPFLFLLELLKDKEIETLDSQEICIPVIYGHNRKCLSICKEKILAVRRGKPLVAVIDSPAEDLYTPRTDVSDIDQRIKDIVDIGNTFKNCLQAACFISVEPAGRRSRIRFNEEFQPAYMEAYQDAEQFVPNEHAEEAFQRAFGAWDRRKDSRNLQDAGPEAESGVEHSIIAAEFFRYAGAEPVTNPDAFLDLMAKKYGFSPLLVGEAIEPYMNRTLDIFESRFLELSSGGTETAIEFERAVAALLRDRLGYEVRLTGQLRREDGRGGYADVLVIDTGEGFCSIWDAKATNSFACPVSDLHAMAHNYIPNYSELFERNPPPLKHATFVAGGFSKNIAPSLSEIEKIARVPCSAIRARDLLSFSSRKDTPGVRRHLNAALAKSERVQRWSA